MNIPATRRYGTRHSTQIAHPGQIVLDTMGKRRTAAEVEADRKEAAEKTERARQDALDRQQAVAGKEDEQARVDARQRGGRLPANIDDEVFVPPASVLDKGSFLTSGDHLTDNPSDAIPQTPKRTAQKSQGATWNSGSQNTPGSDFVLPAFYILTIYRANSKPRPQCSTGKPSVEASRSS